MRFSTNLPKGRIPLPESRQTDPAALMLKIPVDPNRSLVEQSQNADEQLIELSYTDPTISDAVYKVTRAAMCPWYIEVLDPSGNEPPKAAALIKKLTSVLRGGSSLGTNAYVWSESFASLQSQLLRLVQVRGACATLCQLTPSRAPHRILAIDPFFVDWQEEGFQVYKPFLKVCSNNINSLFGSFVGSRSVTSISSSVTSEHVPLDCTFAYSRLDGSPNHPFPISPLTPVLSSVFMLKRFMDSMHEVIERVAWPRVSIKILEEQLKELMPESLQEPQEQMLWLKQQRATVMELFSNLQSGDMIVHSDWVEPSVMSIKDQGGKVIDAEPFVALMTRLLAQGSKTYDSILGGGDNVDPLQAHFQGKIIGGLQEPVEECLSKALTYWLRALGVNATARFVYLPFEMKPESELETSRTFRILNDLKMVAAGVLTPSQFAIRNSGVGLPKGKSALEALFNNSDALLELIGAAPELEPSETDSPSKSPATGPKTKDGRSAPDNASKEGKQGSKKAIGDTKDVRGQSSRPNKPRKPGG